MPQETVLRGDREGRFVFDNATTVRGHVFDVSCLDQRWVIQILVDGLAVAITLADRFEHDLDARGIGDGRYGFVTQLPPEIVAQARCIEARLANLGEAVGHPVLFDADVASGREADGGEADVQWLGGLRFSAWMAQDHREAAQLAVSVDGNHIGAFHSNGWHHNGLVGPDARADAAFDIVLPERFADGRVHIARFADRSANEVGKSTPFIAFEDGLQTLIDRAADLKSERLRGELFDKLVPMALPFTSYDRWRERFPMPPLPAKAKPRKFAVVVVGPDGGSSIETIEAQRQVSWIGLDTPFCDTAERFETASVQAFLRTEAHDCPFVAFLRAGISLHEEALARAAAALESAPGAVMAHSGLLLEGLPGRISQPLFFGRFDYERALEQGYAAGFFVLRRKTAQAVLAPKQTNLPAIVLGAATGPSTAARQIVSVAACLASVSAGIAVTTRRAVAEAAREHLSHRQTKAELSFLAGDILPAIHVRRAPPAGRVTVIIPVRNKPVLLRRCLETTAPAIARLGAELLVVDNDSSDPDMHSLLEGLARQRIRVLRVPGAFNFAKINNKAVAASTTEFVCLLNNDIEAQDNSWLEEMLGRLAEPDVGAVGALLVWPSGVIQHGGVVLGPNLGAAHAFTDRIDRDPGYGDLLRVAHEVSAVTAACLLTRRADYLGVGGLDELAFPINFNDVDYCLKLRANGKRIIFTPHARLIHLESASRGADARPDQARRFDGELRRLRERWLPQIVADPYYSGELSLDAQPFTGLAWPPRR